MSLFQIDLFYENERLYEDYSLLEVTVVFGWQRVSKLKITLEKSVGNDSKLLTTFNFYNIKISY